MKIMKHSLFTLFTLLALLSVQAQAEVAVIVHPDNASELTIKQVKKIFLGKVRVFPNGEDAIPLELSDANTERAEFLQAVLKRDESSLQAYWTRMLFSSQGKPPKQVDTSAAMKSIVTRNPNTIGFINASEVDDSVRVILILP